MSSTTDVDKFLGQQPLRWLHVFIVLMLAAAILIDGYDIFMVGLILPVLAHGLHVRPADLTQVFVLQQLALLIGTLASGPLLDRFGRRRVMLVAMPIFALLTIATSQVTTVFELVALRFVAALFFSSLIPSVITLAAEFAPAKYRAAAVSVVFCDYAGGNLIGASVQAWILPFGWQAAFWVGGVLPLVAAGVIWIWMPESVQFRALRNPQDPTIAATLRRFDPSFEAGENHRYDSRRSEKQGARVSPFELLRSGRTAATLLLWMAYLATGIFSYMNNSWTTTLLHTTRAMPMQHIAGLMAMSSIAGVIGTATSGFVMDRFGATKVVPAYLCGAAVAVAVIASIDVYSVWAGLAFAVLGFLYNGGWGTLNALCSSISPPELRATGVAWAQGAGKIGGMIGPAIGGALVGAGWDFSPVLMVAAGFEVISGLAVVVLLMRRKSLVAVRA